MLVQATLVRAQPINQGGAMTYTGNPYASQTRTTDGQFDTMGLTQALYDAGWQYIRIVSDTNVYVKVNSVASVAPRHLLLAGNDILLKLEKATDTVYAAAA